MASIQDLWSGKMSRERSRPTKAKTSGQSSARCAKSKEKTMLCLNFQTENGTMQAASWERISPSHGGCSMRSIGEFPNEENASTLSQILMAGVPEKYYLSPKACQGILRRASVRGKELPEVLKKALERQACA